MGTRETYVGVLRCIISTDIYQKKLELMKKIVALNAALSPEEQQFFYSIFKMAISGYRHQLQSLNSILQSEKVKFNPQKMQILQKSKDSLIASIQSSSNEAILMIQRSLLPASLSSESSVFYNRIMGDFYRYICETSAGNELNDAISKALKAYEASLELIKSNSVSCGVISLSVSLNYCIFLFEIMGKGDKAIEVAQRAFDEASCLVNDNTEEYYEGIHIQEQLRDRIQTWTKDDNDR